MAKTAQKSKSAKAKERRLTDEANKAAKKRKCDAEKAKANNRK